MTVQQLANRLAALVAQGHGDCTVYTCDGDQCYALGEGGQVVTKWGEVTVSVDEVDEAGVVIDMTAK